MAAMSQVLFGERSLTKVAGLFPTPEAARGAAERVVRGAGLSQAQVRLLSPADGGDPRRSLLGPKLEPESHGIWRTLLRAHLVLGLLGFVAGVALYYALMASGNAALQSSPRLGFAVIVGFATAFGLMSGGLLALRPDHVLLINVVRRALRHGRWAVVAHPLDARQAERAGQALAEGSERVVRSL